MNVLVKLIVVLMVSTLSAFVTTETEAYTITVTVKDAANNEGKIFLALYNSETDFLDTIYKGTKSTITNNGCTVTFKDIPKGVYAISIFHDENDNGKMDTNFVGIPKEAYGCSNNAKGFMGPPKWKDANFELNANKTLTIAL
ncbi:DUF2141 domain-containing protein [Winogradskyella sp.]|nr:DUF2141 domain-containing protein [Winogradskyella sp.]MDC1505929.1 DUF2141 domain-containing protein [Winogradskyella sp.]